MKTETFKKLLEFVIKTSKPEDIKDNISELIDIFESEKIEDKQQYFPPPFDPNKIIHPYPNSPNPYYYDKIMCQSGTKSDPSSYYITHTFNKYNEEK